MNTVTRNAIIGAGLGAGLMFILDPAQGRRRALVRDKFVRAARKTRDAAGATGRDMRNRAQGISAKARSSTSLRGWSLVTAAAVTTFAAAVAMRGRS